MKQKRNLKKQMVDSQATRSFQSSSENLGLLMKILLALSFLINLIFSGGAIYMLYMVRTLQIMLHIPIFKIVLPANLMINISSTIEIAMFDILPAEITTDYILRYDEEKLLWDEENISGQIQDVGYQSHYSVKNLGSISIVMMLYFLKLVFLMLLKLFTLLGLFKEQYSKLHKQVFFSEILAIIIDAYFELLLSGFG